MDKEELIEKIQEYIAENDECMTNHRSPDQEFMASIRNTEWNKALKYVHQLNEPKKVKVPTFVVPFIEKLKSTNKRYGVELEKAYNSSEDGDLVDWLWFNKNILILFNALENGYEVEEEPKWVVIVGNFYLKEPLGDTNIDAVQMSQQKKSAYKFDDKETALLHAKWIGENIAIVEKV